MNEMNELMREYRALKDKIKGWFIYGLGREDNEELDALIDEVAFAARGQTRPDAAMTVSSLSNERFRRRSTESMRSAIESWGLPYPVSQRPRKARRDGK